MDEIFVEIESAMRREGYSDEETITFRKLFTAFRSVKAKTLDWGHITTLSSDELLFRKDAPALSADRARDLLDLLVVCKLNGGLGTSMGLNVPKSGLSVRSGRTFMDFTIQHIAWLRDRYGVDIPLALMNSPRTDTVTQDLIKPYESQLKIYTFVQHFFPRLRAETLTPLSFEGYGEEARYPPGHGDLYDISRFRSLLEDFFDRGKRYLFVSNIDNLSAVPDTDLMGVMVERRIPFLMEVTVKSKADIKGGTPAKNADSGVPFLLEVAQVPEERLDEFFNLKKFPYFNTNNLWFDIERLLALMDQGDQTGDIIVNRKQVSGTPIIQLETAVGGALNRMAGARVMIVGRDRFAPVKTNNDLLLLRSNLFEIVNGVPRRVTSGEQDSMPLIRLGEYHKAIGEFEKRIPYPPKMHELDLFCLVGDVSLGSGISVSGHVLVYAAPGQCLRVPDGEVLNNCLLTAEGKFSLAL